MQCLYAPMPRSFLTARWQSLVLLNYRCPAELLRPLVPAGTELDDWHGVPLVSLVGFRFLHTRVRGLGIPGHRSFEEVNLRFYVRREASDGVRRGVVFIRELVPRSLVAAAARFLYNEPYQALQMGHDVDLTEASGGSARYSWVHKGSTYSLAATVSGPARPLTAGSEAEFITEHYWGYNKQRDGSTLEYRVDHPPWVVWECEDATYSKPPDSSLYGPGFTYVLASKPVSAFMAMGSAIEVHRGTRLGTA